MEYSKGENIEYQVLEAIEEVLKFKDSDTVKASIILRKLRTILRLKDLYEALIHARAYLGSMQPNQYICEQDLNNCLMEIKRALAKAEGK